MAWPVNPSNGQQTTINYVTYVYSSTLGTWTNVGSSAVIQTFPSPITMGSTLGVTGAITASSTVQTTGLGIGTAPSATTGEIRATNAITAFYSDKRLKTEISKIENALDKIDQLTGIIYTQNTLAEQFGYKNYEEQVGLYAQDVKKVQPQAVKPAPFDTNPDGTSISGENYLTVQYEKLIPLLVEAIKELRVEVNALKGK